MIQEASDDIILLLVTPAAGDGGDATTNRLDGETRLPLLSLAGSDDNSQESNPRRACKASHLGQIDHRSLFHGLDISWKISS